MIKEIYTIPFQEGLHARPAKRLVEIARGAQSKITLANKYGSSDAKGILGVMSLQATHGTEMEVLIEGDDEIEVATEIEKFFTQDE